MTEFTRRATLKLGTAGLAWSALPGSMPAGCQAGGTSDGLCHPAVCIRAHQLLSLVCVQGGVTCPCMEETQAREVLERLGKDPTTALRLLTPADEMPHYTQIPRKDGPSPVQDVLNRKRDLDVLQRLGLAPGDTRRARYLFELLFARIETPKGICSHDTPGWEGCPLAKSGAFERVRTQGWKAIVYARTDREREEYRRRNVQSVATAERLFVRPHHLMCLSCWYAGGKNSTPRPNDSLSEIWQRIRREPDVPITLVEGTCMACDCCDGFYPPNGRCVHSCGLIRDYKKDLDVLQKLGLLPGATLPARALFSLLYERIPSTREICAYGDGVVRSEEWKICGGPEGDPGYLATRRTGIF